jgi:hypothetical protein
MGLNLFKLRRAQLSVRISFSPGRDGVIKYIISKDRHRSKEKGGWVSVIGAVEEQLLRSVKYRGWSNAKYGLFKYIYWASTCFC